MIYRLSMEFTVDKKAKNKLFRRIFKKYVEYYKNTNKFRLMHIKIFQGTHY